MQIVFEALAEWPHHGIQLGFTGMPEGRMADIVRQRQRIRQVLTQAEHRRDGPSDLRNLDGVRKAVAEMVGESGGENLGFILKAAECPRVNYPVAVPSKLVAVGMNLFRI